MKRFPLEGRDTIQVTVKSYYVKYYTDYFNSSINFSTVCVHWIMIGNYKMIYI